VFPIGLARQRALMTLNGPCLGATNPELALSAQSTRRAAQAKSFVHCMFMLTVTIF
jgi:hypothetical protein